MRRKDVTDLHKTLVSVLSTYIVDFIFTAISGLVTKRETHKERETIYTRLIKQYKINLLPLVFGLHEKKRIPCGKIFNFRERRGDYQRIHIYIRHNDTIN